METILNKKNAEAAIAYVEALYRQRLSAAKEFVYVDDIKYDIWMLNSLGKALMCIEEESITMGILEEGEKRCKM